jgi:glucokinase
MYYVGIDIGGTTVKAGVVDASGQILQTGNAETPAHDLGMFVRTLSGLIDSFQRVVQIEAVGIGIPGLRSSATHSIEISPNIPCLKKVSLEAELATEISMPVVTRNDANAAAYGEFLFGAGRGTRNMVHLTLGTGLGSGLIVEGRLFEGSSGYAAEFGHTVVEPNGRPCACGSRGCLETLVSAGGIVHRARQKMGNNAPASAKALFVAAAAGNAAALEVFQETGWYLGIACANLINLLNPEVIVMGGGVMGAGEMLLAAARREARLRSFGPSFDHCQIVQSSLWPEAGVIGAAMLARDRQKG